MRSVLSARIFWSRKIAMIKPSNSDISAKPTENSTRLMTDVFQRSDSHNRTYWLNPTKSYWGKYFELVNEMTVDQPMKPYTLMATRMNVGVIANAAGFQRNRARRRRGSASAALCSLDGVGLTVSLLVGSLVRALKGVRCSVGGATDQGRFSGKGSIAPRPSREIMTSTNAGPLLLSALCSAGPS